MLTTVLVTTVYDINVKLISVPVDTAMGGPIGHGGGLKAPLPQRFSGQIQGGSLAPSVTGSYSDSRAGAGKAGTSSGIPSHRASQGAFEYLRMAEALHGPG